MLTLRYCNASLAKQTPSLVKVGIVRPTALLHSSAAIMAGRTAREHAGISRDNLEYGPLVDGPDFSFVDPSRSPPPLTKGQVKRDNRANTFLNRAVLMDRELRIAKANGERVKLTAIEEERGMAHRHLVERKHKRRARLLRELTEYDAKEKEEKYGDTYRAHVTNERRRKLGLTDENAPISNPSAKE